MPLAPGTFTYRAVIALGGQSREMSVTTEIKDDAEGWVITDTATTPASAPARAAPWWTARSWTRRRCCSGSARSRRARTRSSTSSWAARWSGSSSSAGRRGPFSADIGGDLFNDAAGLYQSIATLPFAPGYKIAFRTFDVQVQRVRTVRLQVLGSEPVTVPAGTFDAFKIELANADDEGKTTVWVAKDGRKVVKFVGVRPQLQGATVTSELVK